MKDFYSLSYGKYSTFPARRYSYNLRLLNVKDALKNKKYNTILDIGSASADYAIDLKAEGYDVVCVDINHKHLRVARNKDKSVTAVNADVHSLPFTDAAFDAVMILNAFRYLNNPLASLKECNRVLKREGYFILIDHNRFCPDTLIVKKDVVRYYSLRELHKLLAMSKFNVITSQSLFVPPPTKSKYFLNLMLDLSTKLRKVLKGIYPEIFILSTKDD
jgi:SAM-dependent methyltransferase